MAISLNHEVHTNEDYKSFDAIREGILVAAKEAKEAERHDRIEIEIEGGWYYIDKPFRLSREENPELASLEITLRGKGGDSPKIHSLNRIDLVKFERVEGKPYLKYQLPKDENGDYPKFHDLFLNANYISPAKSTVWSNPDRLSDEERAGSVKRDGFYIPLDAAKAIAGGTLGSAELTILVEWEFAILHIESVDLSKTKTFNGEVYALARIVREDMDAFAKDCHRILNIGSRETFISNTPALLTQPNTYAYDYARGILYVLPKNTEDLRGQFVQYPSAENLFEIEGLENFTMENIVFTATTTKLLCDRLYHSGQANNVKGTGRLGCAALKVSNVKNFKLRACEFIDLGTNGVLFVNASDTVSVTDCVFRNVAMSALSIGNPTTKWEEEKNRNFAVTVENNRFEKIGYAYPSALCIYVGMVDGLKVLRNTIEGCAYSAMSIGWGWLPVPYAPGESCNVRCAEIAYNYIHNYMDVLRDGGAIYVLGGNANPDICADRFNCMHDNYAELDIARDGSKYGYYCDGATTNWEVRHNVIINCMTPLYSQHHPGALSYHNHFFDNYSTTYNRGEFHAPGRDVLFYDCHVVEDSYDALAKAYPVVEEIKKNAGARLLY